MPAAQPSRPGRRCARLVLALLRDGRTRPDEWDHAERSAVTRLHSWAFRHGARAWPALAERVEENGQGAPASADERPYRCPTCGVRLAEPVEVGFPQNLANEARDDDRFAAELLTDLQRLGDTYGPLGVAIAAASLTDRRALIALLIDGRTRQPVPEALDLGEAGGTEPLDGQIARLAGWIVENVPGEPSRSEGAVDCAIRLLAQRRVYREDVEESANRAEQEHARRLGAEREQERLRRQLATVIGERDRTRDARVEVEGELRDARDLAQQRLDEANRLRDERDEARRLFGSAKRHTERNGVELPDLPPDAEEVRRFLGVPRENVVEVTPLREVTSPHPIEEDPYRPHADSWPDDGVLLRYVELRRLVSLHLERYADTRTARAMLEGDVPLRLSEVLDR